jgi:hypothetical protein
VACELAEVELAEVCPGEGNSGGLGNDRVLGRTWNRTILMTLNSLDHLICDAPLSPQWV